jgi:uncharacterized protein (TIGR03435 family)
VGKSTCAIALVAAAAVASAQTPAFEAASVKLNTDASSLRTSTFFQRSSQVSIVNHPLRLLMAMAFNLDLNKSRALIMALPGWADADGWNIQAAAAGVPSNEQKRLMLQALLGERFALAVHRETRQLPVFALVLVTAGRPGRGIRPPTDEAVCKEPPPAAAPLPPSQTPTEAAARAIRAVPSGRITGGLLGDDRTQAWTGGRRVSLATFAALLGEQTPLDLPVVLDRTRLDGLFDIAMVWNPQIQDLASNAADPAGVTFTQALREQLGLRLQRDTGPIEVLVVDRVERPTTD